MRLLVRERMRERRLRNVRMLLSIKASRSDRGVYASFLSSHSGVMSAWSLYARFRWPLLLPIMLKSLNSMSRIAAPAIAEMT